MTSKIKQKMPFAGRHKGFSLLFLVVCFYLMANYVLLPWFGGTDLYSFKDPGVNYASGRGFIGENLPTMPQGVRTLYLEYTPLYPFLFGLWCNIVGIGLKQATVFNALIDILRTVILFLFARRVIHGFMKREGEDLFSGDFGKADLYAAAISVLTLPLRTGYGDRPDDLAVSLQMLVIYFSIPTVKAANHGNAFLVNSPGRREFFLCGICAGLTFLVSPSIGFFSVILIASLIVISDENSLNMNRFMSAAKNTLSSAGGFFLTVVPVAIIYHLLDPDAFLRFRRHGGRFAFRAFQSLIGGDPSIFSEQLSWALRVGKPYILFALTELVVAVAAIAMFTRKARTGSGQRYPLAVIVALLASTAAHFIFFTPQFIYLWSIAFISVALIVAYLPCLFSSLGLRRSAIAISIFALVGLSGVWAISGLFWIEALQRPSHQSPDVNRQMLLESIPRGSRVLATPVHYWLLRSDYDIANPDNVREWSSYEYLVVPCNGTGTPAKPYSSTHAEENHFESNWEMVRNTLNPDPLGVFRMRISKSSWGYGFALYRNKISKGNI